MRETELRIGNYYRCHKGDIFKWSFDNFNSLSTNCIEIHHYCTPIPLTEEWLLKFGFLRTKNKLVLRTGNYNFNFDGRMFTISHITSSWMTYIEQVHQLQNLYFALTNEELKLTE